MVYHTTLQNQHHLCLIFKCFGFHSIFQIRIDALPPLLTNPLCPCMYRNSRRTTCQSLVHSLYLLLKTKRKNLQGCLITLRCYPPNYPHFFSCKIVGFFCLWIVWSLSLFLCKKIFTVPPPRLINKII